MISFLRGTILMIRESSLVVDVHDIGYAVSVPGSSLLTKKIGDAVELFIHQHVKEDGLDLYGFETNDELYLFEKLISVSGVGPKTGLAALSSASVEGITNAIAHGDAALLRSVSGIGAKTAERIMVELKNSFVHMTSAAQPGHASDKDVIEALQQFGYSPKDAHNALRAVPSSAVAIEDRLKEALKVLSKQ